MLSSNEKVLNPADGHVSYDKENFQTGTQSLKVAFQSVSGNWQLSQGISLEAGKRYRASAVVRGEEPLNLRLVVLDAAGKGHQVRAVDQLDWQRLSVDFVTPGHSGKITLRVWSSKTNAGKAAWVDSVSVRELQEEELDENGKVIIRPQQILEERGENLLVNADFQALSKTLEGTLPKGWGLSFSAERKDVPDGELRHIAFNRDAGALEIGFKNSKGNLLLSQSVKLVPGGQYRATAKLQSDFPLQVVLGVKTADQKNHSARPLAEKDWQIQTVDFTVPEQAGSTNIRIWASNLPENQLIRIASVSVRELTARKMLPE